MSKPTAQPSIWLQAFSPAYKAAGFGGLIATAAVSQARTETTFGERLLLYLVFGASLATFFFTIAYLIALAFYAAKRH